MAKKNSIAFLLMALVTITPIHGFTVTMSSYLDKLASGQSAGLTSFAPSSTGQNTYGSSYSYGSSPAAPANYAAAAPVAPTQSSYSYGGSPAQPAPTPVHVNTFAHIQPSNSLNYIATLGGGNAKKWGRDYSGVSSTFRPTFSVGIASYLDNLKGKVFASSQPQQMQTPTASSQGSYSYDPSSWMSNSAPAPSTSYSYGGSPAPAPASSNQSYSYGGSPAPAPASSNQSYNGGSPAPANPSYSYGGSAATPAYSYGGSLFPAPSSSNQSYSYGGSPAPANESYSYGGSATTPAYSYGGSPTPAPSNESYSYGGSVSPSYGALATNTAPKSTSSYLESL